MRATLVSELTARASELSARVIEDMYRDPFWLARFGERGRKFADDDGRRHLSYLEQALVAQDPGVLAGYVRWLRPLLTTRGMCTLHLDENFERLARAIEAEIPEPEPALAYLELGRDALRYASGIEGELEAVKARVIEAVAAEVAETSRASSAREIAHIFSYLRDAAALARPELFVEYVAFAHDLTRRRERAGGELARALGALARLLESDPAVSPAARAFARDALAGSVARLEAAPHGDAVSGGEP